MLWEKSRYIKSAILDDLKNVFKIKSILKLTRIGNIM